MRELALFVAITLCTACGSDGRSPDLAPDPDPGAPVQEGAPATPLPAAPGGYSGPELPPLPRCASAERPLPSPSEDAPPATDCADVLRPLPPMHVHRTFVDRDHGRCSARGGDGSGNLAVLLESHVGGHEPSYTWQFVSPAGETSTVSLADGEVLALPRGFVAWGRDAGTLRYLDEAGRPLCSDSAPQDATLAVAGPRGAPTVLSPWPSRPVGRSWAGLDDRERVLVLQNEHATATIWGRWFERDGTPLTGAFLVASDVAVGDAPGGLVTAQVHGGLAIGQWWDASLMWSSSRWVAVVPSGSTDARPAPDWLASRPNTRLLRTRGGYAVLHDERFASACANRLEILNSAGESCGVVDLVIDSRPCDNLALRVGLDGTLIQPLPSSHETLDGADPSRESCTIRYWPAALP